MKIFFSFFLLLYYNMGLELHIVYELNSISRKY